MKLFNKFKRQIRCLIERIKLSESDYATMKTQSQMYKAMMSTIEYSSNLDWEDAFDATGGLITKIYKARTDTIHINITEMLAAGGITFNKNVVKLYVTGL